MSSEDSWSLRLLVSVWLCLGLSSCTSVTLENYVLPTQPPTILAGKTVAVLPFNGSAPVLAPAGEWFAHNLAKVEGVKVLSPAEVELRLHDKMQRDLLPWKSSQDAAAIGRILGTQLVVMGQLSRFAPPPDKSLGMEAVCDVTLIDSANGDTVSHFTGVDHLYGGWDYVIFYMRAANKAAYGVIGAKNIE